VNIIEALDDPALFQPHFRGSSWAAWRSFLTARGPFTPPPGAGACPRPRLARRCSLSAGEAQVARPRVDSGLSGLFSGLCPLPRARRGRHHCDPRCESLASAQHLPIRIWPVESRPVALVIGRRRDRRADHTDQSSRHRDQHRVVPNNARLQPPPFSATRSRFGDRMKRPQIRMSRS
jgi:hypothetical protein